MQQESFDHILALVKDNYRNVKSMNDVIEEVFSETKKVYYEAMQKSVLQNVLVVPKIKGLEGEVFGLPPKEPE